MLPHEFIFLYWPADVRYSVELDDRHDESMHHAKNTTHAMQWTTASGRKLFDSSNCDKTITLACLSVIWAIKGDVGVADEDALEGIR